MPALVVNNHVSKLGRFLTFKSGDLAYAERALSKDKDGKDRLEKMETIETRAVGTLVSLTEQPSTRVVVLTGDAGHGKTHLCRVAIERVVGIDAHRALRKLVDYGDGSRPVERVGARDLYVIKDLSELKVRAVSRLVEAVEAEDRITLVCANEGKLRAVVADADGKLDELRHTLEETQRSGRISTTPGLVVLDLNHQSVTAGGEESFVFGILKHWALDGRRWKKCGDCPAQRHCPILENRRLLAGEDDEQAGRRRREGLQLVLRVAEQAGSAITIRETLVLVAFAITGGLNCKQVQLGEFDVDPHAIRTHLFHQVIFNPPLSKDERASLSLLRVLSRLDPGRNAIRSVDEALISSPSEEWTSGDAAGAEAKPTTRKQIRTEARRHRETLAILRRRDFFDLRSEDEWRRMRGDDAPNVPRAERLGFRHHEQFQSVVDSGTPAAVGAVRDRLLRGLEAVQDVRRGAGQMTSFAVVDPAYAIVSGTASILSRQISAKRIDVVPLQSHWASVAGEESRLPSSVDWIDRRIAIVFRPGGLKPIAVDLDLVQFEFVLRSAAGLASRRFFQGDIRRITSRLDRLAEADADSDEEIKVIYGDRVLSLLVEEDGRIRCEGGR